LLDERVEALPDLVPRAVTVDVVHLVEIDPVRLQPAEAALAMFTDLVGTEAGAIAVDFRQIGLAIDRVIDLRCQYDGVAAAAALRQPAPDDFLGRPVLDVPAVNIGRVEEIDAEFQRPVHDPEAVLFRGVPAEVHRAETDIADQHPVIAQTSMFHCHMPLPGSSFTGNANSK
jgi:hypothetical protein